MNFKDLGISAEGVSALSKMKIVKPTPVQVKAIPVILKGDCVMAQSKTGTGKTLAFVLPIIEQLKYQNNEVLILLPTRELAKQVEEVVRDVSNNKVRSMTIYGGVSINNQIQKLEKGVNVIVGTPGRIIDLYKRRKLKLDNIRFVVLDEADRLWDMGFAPDVKYILNQVKTNYQFMLFSATLDADMRALVQKYSKNKFEFLNLSRDEMTVGSTRQYYYMIDQFNKKFSTFKEVLKREKPNSALVFVNTKKTADWLYGRMKKDKLRYKLGIISGSLSQFQREKILTKYRNKEIDILIATDVAARGLDIDDISHVFNYDIPQYPENYVHRIGRTSRMGKKGVAITLVLNDEYEYLCHIEGLIDKEIKEKTLYHQDNQRNRFPFY